MHKLEAVEKARSLMLEAQDWSVWRWLTEKGRVRTVADLATAALDAADRGVKNSWSEDLCKAYAELVAEAAVDGHPKTRRQFEKAKREAQDIDAAIKTAARRVKVADDAAYRARMDAEEMFAEAERRLSASMARAAAGKALEVYDLRESAIRKSEVAARRAEE